MQRRVVCAAIQRSDGRLILGIRHFDRFMREAAKKDGGEELWWVSKQGFVDQRGEFMTREEAHVVAKAAGQIVRRVGGDHERLFSENLY